jgi:transcriptional regulator
MHPSPQFRWRDEEQMRAFAAEIGFGMLFAQTPDGPRVAHMPFLIRADGSIAFHLSRGNAMAGHLDGDRALLVVNGPDAYVSPDWYGLDDQVPTWNYLTVEMEGTVSTLDDGALPDLIDALSFDRERRLAPKAPWTSDKMTPGLFDRMMGAITGYALTVDAWRGTRKLGQNKPADARENVAMALDSLGEGEMAALMRGLS